MTPEIFATKGTSNFDETTFLSDTIFLQFVERLAVQHLLYPECKDFIRLQFS